MNVFKHSIIALIVLTAAGCQKDIVRKIREKGGDYVLGLKKNHPKLYESVFQHIAKEGELSTNRLHDEFDDNHGRLVRRRCFGYDVSKLSLFIILYFSGEKNLRNSIGSGII